MVLIKMELDVIIILYLWIVLFNFVWDEIKSIVKKYFL